MPGPWEGGGGATTSTQHGNDDDDLAHRSLYQLMMLLEQQGWVWGAVPAKRSNRRRLAYGIDIGAPKVYRTFSPTAQHRATHLYLQCLLSANHIIALNPGNSKIPSGYEEPYYRRLLRGEPVQEMEMDIDADAVVQRNPVARRVREPEHVMEREGEQDEPLEEGLARMMEEFAPEPDESDPEPAPDEINYGEPLGNIGLLNVAEEHVVADGVGRPGTARCY